MLNACEVGVFVKERGRRGRGGCCVCGGGGLHSVLFLIDQQLLPSVRREKRKREGCTA